MAGAPTILLGVGATKSGTSWLYRYLADHPECHFRTIKELHYFDALERGTIERQIEERMRECDAIRARIASGKAGAAAEGRLTDREDWLSVLRAPGKAETGYLGYLDRGARGCAVVGEVTPSYALLSEDRLRAMAGLGARDVRMVYLLRDPVERLWSHVRMIAGRRSPDGAVTRARCNRILARTLAGEESEISVRGDYRAALAKLGRAVDPARLLVLVFEDLVSGEAVARLCGFLGIAHRRPDLAPVHPGQPMRMTADQRRAARAWLAGQYDFVPEALGYRPASWAYDLAEVRS
jgi:hypothetical protein